MIVSHIYRMLKRNTALCETDAAEWRREKRQRYTTPELTAEKPQTDVMSVSTTLPDMNDGARREESVQKHHSTRKDRLKVQRIRELKPVNHIGWAGMRMATGIIVLAVVAFALIFLHLADYSRVTQAQKDLVALQERVERARSNVEQLEKDYDSAAASINVAYQAKQHGLISAKKVQAVELYVPANAVINPADVMPELPRDILATILGD